ncbi:MAG: hypothetical protein CMM93_04405 [Rickettsiales bacterium]|nr:hypothetical protein [Rickettsiales bacterium]|tara:strand:+ start:314 stop:772 length:459 start_codon:yes stop_codon:yes gene_type:complete
MFTEDFIQCIKKFVTLFPSRGLSALSIMCFTDADLMRTLKEMGEKKAMFAYLAQAKQVSVHRPDQDVFRKEIVWNVLEKILKDLCNTWYTAKYSGFPESLMDDLNQRFSVEGNTLICKARDSKNPDDKRYYPCCRLKFCVGGKKVFLSPPAE